MYGRIGYEPIPDQVNDAAIADLDIEQILDIDESAKRLKTFEIESPGPINVENKNR